MINSLRRLKALYPYKVFYNVPYLVPPWSDEEIEIFWDYFLKGKNIPSDAFEDKIREKLKSNYNVFFVDSGRHAIKVLLKALSFPPKSEIIVPVLCCNAIPKTIEECGLTSSFADIGNDLCLTVDSIKKAISSKTKGIMLVHAGGAAAGEYKEIIEFCNRNGLFLIDNAAQSWGNETDGIWLGGRGNAGIVSFGLGKSTFGIGGGMLISNLSEIGNKGDRKIYNRLNLLDFYLQYLKRSYTAPFFLYINKLRPNANSKTIRDISHFDKMAQYSIFKHLDTIIKKRTEISLTLISILDKEPISFPQQENKHVWTKLIIRIPEKLRVTFQQYLYMNRIETEDYYNPHYLNNYWKDRAMFSKIGYPFAEKFYKELLILPNSPGLNYSQLKYLYRIIENFKGRHL